MLRELVANNIFVFTSELYAQVTAGAILTPDGAIVIDTLPFPTETRQMIQYIEERRNALVHTVINTHYHADHTFGTCFFEDARVVSHSLTRKYLASRGQQSIDEAQRGTRGMMKLSLRLPDMTFNEGRLMIHFGGQDLELIHTPGHSPDAIVCHVINENILFAADTIMAIPYFGDGSWSDYVTTLNMLRDDKYEGIVQGHGEVILRGEVDSRFQEDLDYLHIIRERVENLVKKGEGPAALESIDIEECGKSRIALNGLVTQLHSSNLQKLYQEISADIQ